MLHYCTALLLTDEYVIAGNNKGALYVWHRKNGRLVEKYHVHTGAIGCIDFMKSHLSTEKKIGSSFLRVITGGIEDSHVGLTKIRAIALNKWGGLLPQSRSEDAAHSAKRDIKILRGHSGPVRQVHIDIHKAVSCSDDGSIKIWDLQHGHKGRVVRTLRLKGNRVPIVSLLVDSRIIIGGAADGSVSAFFFNSAFDPRTSTCKRRKSFQGEHKSKRKSSKLGKKKAAVKVSPFTPVGSNTSRSDRRQLRDLKAWCNRADVIDDYDDDENENYPISPSPTASPTVGRYMANRARGAVGLGNFMQRVDDAEGNNQDEDIDLQFALALSMEDL